MPPAPARTFSCRSSPPTGCEPAGFSRSPYFWSSRAGCRNRTSSNYYAFKIKIDGCCECPATQKSCGKGGEGSEVVEGLVIGDERLPAGFHGIEICEGGQRLQERNVHHELVFRVPDRVDITPQPFLPLLVISLELREIL